VALRCKAETLWLIVSPAAELTACVVRVLSTVDQTFRKVCCFTPNCKVRFLSVIADALAV